MKTIFKLKFSVITLLAGLLLLTALRYPAYKNVKIVFIGDSITQGENNPALQPSVYAVNELKARLGTDSVLQANCGISGKTTLDYLPGQSLFTTVISSADVFYNHKDAQLLFSIMLGTNDSAMKGTHGAPVAVVDYRKNLKVIIDSLLRRYPNSKVVVNHPIWYSPNTYNGAMYLAEGLARLQSYFPEIDDLVKNYGLTNPGHVFKGDTNGFDYFKSSYESTLKHEQGRQGIFYLHPNDKGAAGLGGLWAKAIYKALN